MLPLRSSRSAVPAPVRSARRRSASSLVLGIAMCLLGGLPTSAHAAVTWVGAGTGSGTTTASAAAPAATAPGDLLVAVVATRSATAAPAPAGWILVRSDVSGVLRRTILSRSATVAGAQTFSFTATAAASTSVAVVTLHGAAVAIDASSSQAGTSTSIVAPAVTTSVANGFLLALPTSNATATLSTPVGMTSRASLRTANRPSVAVFSQQLAAAGSTGARTSTAQVAGANLGALIAVRPDTTAPVAAVNAFTPISGAAGQAVRGTTLYVNPATPGSVSLGITATDADSGVAAASFPALGTRWTPTAVTSDTTAPYAVTYAWTAGPASPGPRQVTVSDRAGNLAPVAFSILTDAAAPTGGSVGYANTATAATSTTVTVGTGSDAGAGVATWQLQRRSAALSNGACGVFGAWTNLGPANTASPFTDATLTSGTCVQYQVVSVDAVGNAATFSSTNVLRVDAVSPTGSIAATPTSPLAGTVTLTGTANDPVSGVQSLDVTFSGATSGTVCTRAAGGAWSCAWDTTSLPDGPYVLTLTVRDAAGNAATAASRSVVVDNGAPTVSISEITPVANPAAQWVAGTTVFVQPATSGSFTVAAAASDPGTGIASVAFPSLGAGWTPAGSSLSAAPYELTYAWAPGATSPGAAVVTATDAAGRSATAGFSVQTDGSAPVGGSLSYTDGEIDSAAVAITVTAPVDAGSGVGSTHLQRRAAAYVSGGCHAFGAWSDLADVASAQGTVDDATLVSGTCYQYRLFASDHVGNVSVSETASILRVQSFAPTGTIAPTPTSPFSGTMVVSGTANAPAGSSVTATFTGTATGTVCTGVGIVGSTWSCAWNTTMLPDGPYTLHLAVVAAGGASQEVAARTVLVDNAPSQTTSVELVPLTGIAYQLSTGSTLYFNPAESGSFDVRVAAFDAGTGVHRVEFPALGAGWAPATAGTDASAPYSFTYTWTQAAAGPGTVFATVYDNAGNSSTVPFRIEADSAPPVGGTISYPSVTASTGGVAVSFTSAVDTISGVDSWQLRRRTTTYVNGVCNVGSWTPFWDLGGPSPASPYVDTSLTTDTCYEYQLLVRDRVGNVTTYTAGHDLRVHDGAPAGSIDDPGAALAGTVSVSGASTAGDAPVDFVELTYSGPANGAICIAPPSPTAWSCAWDTTAVPDGPYTLTLTVHDSSGATNAALIQRSVMVANTPDDTPPAGGAISYANGFTNVMSTTIAFSLPADAGSGIASWQLQRASSPLSGGVCGSFSAWTNLGPVSPSSPYADTTLSDGTCAMYRLLATDGAGNTGVFTSPNVLRVDTTSPIGTIGAAPAGPVSGFVTLTGTSGDTGSGVSGVDVTYAGPNSGGICFQPPSPDSWSCTWDTTTISDGVYTVSATMQDLAGNSSTPISRTLIVDNTPPVMAVESLQEQSNPAAQFVVGSTLWFNPTSSGSFTLTVNASDAGAGIDHVDFPALGAGWTQSTMHDATPPFSAVYSWSPGATTPGQFAVTDVDVAGNTTTVPATVSADASSPVGAAISYPDGAVTGPVQITWITGTDMQSGIGSWHVERATATWASGVCGAFGPFTPIGPKNPTSPLEDSTLPASTCARYRLLVADNVDNVAVVTAPGVATTS